MSSCADDQFQDQLPEWVAGRLPPAERAAVDAHLAACAACRSDAALIAAVRRALPAPPPMDVARIAAALPAAPRRSGARPSRDAAPVIPIAPRRGPGRRWLLTAAVAGGAMAAAAAGLMVARPDGPPPGGAPLPAASAPAAAVQLASFDAATLTPDEFDALMDELEGTDEVLAPVVEPPADTALGGA